MDEFDRSPIPYDAISITKFFDVLVRDCYAIHIGCTLVPISEKSISSDGRFIELSNK